MKVLIFTTLFPNAVQRYLGLFSLERAKELAQLVEVQVMAPVPYFPPLRCFRRWYPFSQIPHRENKSGIVIHHPRYFIFPKVGMVLYGLFMFLSVLRRVDALRRKFDFDLIDAHFVYPDGFAAVLLGKVLRRPVVVTSHGTDLNLYSRFPLVRKLLIYTLSKADAVVTVSKALKNQALWLGASQEKVSVIPNGVQLSKFRPIPQPEARRRLGLPENRRILLSVGLLIPRKGFRYLIEAVGQLVQDHAWSDLLLIIVGEGRLRPVLERLIRERGLGHHVMLAGAKPHEEIYLWQGAADLFCLASSREGWPTVFFETFACGKPVVATKVWGAPEAIPSDDYGILVDGQDPKLLAQGVRRAFERPWDAEKLICYAEENTWRHVAERVLARFQDMVDESARGRGV